MKLRKKSIKRKVKRRQKGGKIRRKYSKRRRKKKGGNDCWKQDYDKLGEEDIKNCEACSFIELANESSKCPKHGKHWHFEEDPYDVDDLDYNHYCCYNPNKEYNKKCEACCRDCQCGNDCWKQDYDKLEEEDIKNCEACSFSELTVGNVSNKCPKHSKHYYFKEDPDDEDDPDFNHYCCYNPNKEDNKKCEACCRECQCAK